MPFVFKITTTSSPQTFTIPGQFSASYTYNAVIDWGDGSPTSTINTWNDADLAHEYATAGQYTITVSGTFPSIYFNNGGDKLLLDEVVDLGNVGWKKLNAAFYGCLNLISFNVGTADLQHVDNLSYMFRSSGVTSVDFSNKDLSNVQFMQQMFRDCSDLLSAVFTNCTFPSLIDISLFLQNAVKIAAFDLTPFSTAVNATKINNFFTFCAEIVSLDLTPLPLSSGNITSLQNLCWKCTKLETVVAAGLDMSNITSIKNMLRDCPALVNLGDEIKGWDITSLTEANSFLSGSNLALTQSEYDEVLLAWAQQSLNSGLFISFGDAQYTGIVALSGVTHVFLNYNDTGVVAEQTIFDWRLDANNRITITLDTNGVNTGLINLTMVSGGVQASTAASVQLTPGLEKEARVAWRATDAEIQIALNGVAEAALASGLSVPDLSAASASIDGIMGYHAETYLWDTDIGQAGLEVA